MTLPPFGTVRPAHSASVRAAVGRPRASLRGDAAGETVGAGADGEEGAADGAGETEGGEGIATADDDADADEVPTALVALTVKAYEPPGARSVNVHVVAGAAQTAPPGEAVTV